MTCPGPQSWLEAKQSYHLFPHTGPGANVYNCLLKVYKNFSGPLLGQGGVLIHSPQFPDPGTRLLPGGGLRPNSAILGFRDLRVTAGRNSTLICPLRARCCPQSVWLPPSQFPDHSGNGRNVRVTSMVTLEVTVTQPDNSTRQEGLWLLGVGQSFFCGLCIVCLQVHI